MPDQSSPLEKVAHDPSASLLLVRMMWAGCLVGIAVFAGFIALGVNPPADSASTGQWVRLPLFVAFILIPVGYLIRYQIFKRGRRQQAVNPKAFAKGNAILFAILELVAIMSLVTVIIAFAWWPAAGGVVLAMLVLLINWPIGRHLFPEAPKGLDS
ncbi:MAG: hypothetical protein JJU36_13350 [Phycisphaeraceae bacterium]|nr:hypothetical protein [Phycisphaeraceae bacterium]